MYTNANFWRDMAILAGSLGMALYSLIQMMDTVTCNGNGCSASW
jgi:hypothetical protein